MENNTSGQGKGAPVPFEIRGWNWGAFFFNWIWGIGNSTYIALLALVPFVNLVMVFVLGARGNEWAWQNRPWRSVEHFKNTQRKWAWASLIIFVVMIPTCVGVPMSLLKNSEAFSSSLSQIQQNPDVLSALGTPIEAGLFVSGSISTSGPDGNANLQYSLQGSKAKGKAYVYARKHAGQWQLQEVTVEVSGSGQRIAVVTPSGGAPDAAGI